MRALLGQSQDPYWSPTSASAASAPAHARRSGQFVGWLAWWRQFDECENRAALLLGQPGPATRTGLHAQSIHALGVEGAQAIPDRLRMAAEFVRDLARAEPVPAASDHLGVHDPVGGRVNTVGELAHLALLERVEGRASHELFGHGRLLRSRCLAYFEP
jgi:hypothetical protein